MSKITYNGVESPSQMVTFTEIPNILTISESQSGTFAQITLTFNGNLKTSVTSEGQYYITFLGETISSTMDASLNSNKLFYISADEDATAMNVSRALRNCNKINAEFKIVHGGNVVNILAKSYGSKWDDFTSAFVHNIPSVNLAVTYTAGTASSSFYGGKIDIDVYDGDSTVNGNYITTLEKNYYGDSCSFNMSPLLATISEYGMTKPYGMLCQLITNEGEWQHLGQISAHTAIGYHANQSENYLDASVSTQFLAMTERDNEQIDLYTYDKTIPFSVLVGSNTSGYSVRTSLKNSAEVELWSKTDTYQHTSSNRIDDIEVTISSAPYLWENAAYIDVTVGSNTPIRYTVIKPLKAAENYQRILWRNEYGGISFFDFTGQRSESDKVDIETYEKNNFDYYTSNAYEKKKIYSNDYNKTVSLTSHLMKENGKYIFNSLMRSKKVWTEINGETYYIIPQSIEVVEDQNYNGIYTAKLTYIYSDI